MTRRIALAFTTLLAAALGIAAESSPPWDAYRYYLRGLLSERAGRRDAARTDFERALSIDPHAVGVRRDLAGVLASLRRYDDALAAAERAVQDAPQDAGVHLLLGKIRLERREIGPARAAFDRALQLDPGNAEALFFATQSRDAAQADESLGVFQKFIQSNPDSGPAQWGLAELQQKLGDLKSAEDSWKKLLEQDPNRFEAYFGLAQIYDVRRDTEAARAAYERCRFLDPKNVPVLARLGEIYFQAGQPDRAAEAFDQAAQFGGDNDALRFWRAILAEGRGDWARAADEMGAVAKSSSEPGVLIRLAGYQSRLTEPGTS
jgi:tetratricopeptide (TPR) repeat protein